jgi:hypothetical protein
LAFSLNQPSVCPADGSHDHSESGNYTLAPPRTKLQSDLFGGNERLERCAVNHADHVTPGSTGDFVSKIQEALVILDDAILTGADVASQTYGQPTADAVLAYKTKRGIINRAYQTAPDNIVGIMTINRMDAEMVAVEARMPDMIESARRGAFLRTFNAFTQAAGLGPPPPPGRVDPNEAKRLRARDLAMSIFNDLNPDMDRIGDTLGDMKNRIASGAGPLVLRAHFPDKDCGFRDGYVQFNQIPISLCPRFFAVSDEERIRTMVHESAHLTGIGDSNGESYYTRYNSKNEDPDIILQTGGSPPSTNRYTIADTWAKYVNAVTDQPADPDP